METTATITTETTPRRRSRRRYRCMFQDAKGRWWLDYYTPAGARRRKLAGRTKADAERMLRQIRSGMDAGEYVDTSKAPGFSDFCRVFDERHGQHLASYRSASGRARMEHLKNFFGNRKLSSITAEMIEQYRLHRLETPDCRNNKSAIARSTVNREMTMLRAILSKAVKWGVLAKSPAERVQDYDEGERRERYLQGDEIRRLLQATKRSASPILRPAVYLALQTGMRKGELLGLRWQDVDFESGQLLIPKSKTGKARHVVLSRRARWLLSKMAARNPMSEWVFETRRSDGSRSPAGDIKTAWQAALRRARIEDCHFHDLRHTFASHFVMNGGNIYALAKMLGHASPKMTLERYAHLSPTFLAEQRAVLDRGAYAPANRHQMDTDPSRTPQVTSLSL